MKVKSLLKKAVKNHKHIVCIIITLAFVLMTFLLFWNSIIRIIEAFRDLGLSIAYSFSPDNVTPTVNDLSSVGFQDLGLIPKNLELFNVKLRLYGKMLINKFTLSLYKAHVQGIMYDFSYLLLAALLPILILCIAVLVLVKRKNNNYNKDTKPLKVAKVISDYTYRPVKSWVHGLITFIKEHKYYYITWACIWLFNFNGFTVLIEFLAFYFYCLGSMKLINLYIQVYKLLLDLSVMITFIPVWLWAIIGGMVFCLWRSWHSYKKLKKLEEKCEEHVQSLPISSLIVGPMGTKKTTFLSDIAITANKLFRDVAYKRIIANDMKFPFFPWINLERCILYGIEHHTIYNLATCKKFISAVRVCYERAERFPQLQVHFFSALKSRYGYQFDNFIFDYDVNRYGYVYDDKLTLQSVFDVLETYAQLYFIYVVSCTLLYSNYAVRADGILKNEGNFPKWDIDFFRKDTAQAMNNTRLSHILDFDMCRLGKTVSCDSRFKDSLDFGIIVITEVAKERGNQYTVAAHKLITADLGVEANQDNDLFNVDVKLCRARSTVDNFPFVLFLLDDQRADSLGADFKQICDIVYIYESTDFKLKSPLYAVDELIYQVSDKIFGWFYKEDRFKKGGNSLLRHFFKCVYYAVLQHHINIFNRFAVSDLSFTVQDGRMEGEAEKKKYTLMKNKIHKAVFATDCWAAYYYVKHMRSKYGILDIPEYSGTRATIDEIAQQHSYFDMDCRGTIAKS